MNSSLIAVLHSIELLLKTNLIFFGGRRQTNHLPQNGEIVGGKRIPGRTANDFKRSPEWEYVC